MQQTDVVERTRAIVHVPRETDRSPVEIDVPPCDPSVRPGPVPIDPAEPVVPSEAVAPVEPAPEAEPAEAQDVRCRPTTVAALRNVRLMHMLERIGRACNEAGIPIMALKGAVLNAMAHDTPDERPMSDLDLLVREADLERVHRLLEELGCLRAPSQFREDFFPRFYYEIQYKSGGTCPVTIDLHVRAFRPLRCARLIPADALWCHAVPLCLGRATILRPGDEDMLIHLAAHCAWHGNDDPKWLDDIRRWCLVRGGTICAARFLERVRRWELTAPVRAALEATYAAHGTLVRDDLRTRLGAARAGWRERLILWHAPRDIDHLYRSALVNAITVPGWRFRFAYLASVVNPDGPYMADWGQRNGCDRPRLARLVRSAWPIVRRVPGARRWMSRVEVRESPVHGFGVFATRDIRPGEEIARYRGAPIERDGVYVAYHQEADGAWSRHEITGRLRFLNHSCRPNAELRNFRLVALGPVRAGQELVIDYGECTCRQEGPGSCAVHEDLIDAEAPAPIPLGADDADDWIDAGEAREADDRRLAA